MALFGFWSPCTHRPTGSRVGVGAPPGSAARAIVTLHRESAEPTFAGPAAAVPWLIAPPVANQLSCPPGRARLPLMSGPLFPLSFYRQPEIRIGPSMGRRLMGRSPATWYVFRQRRNDPNSFGGGFLEVMAPGEHT